MSGRVLFAAPSAYVLSGLAGWLDYLIPGLERQGWDPLLGLVEGPRFHRPDAYLAAHPCQRVVRIPCRTCTPAGRHAALVRTLRRYRPDIVASVNIPDLYGAAAALRGTGAAPACVMTLHGISACLTADMRRYADVLDAVIATNRLACRLATQALGDDGRVHYAAYGVPVPECLPERHPQPAGRLTVLYAGRLDQPQKRVLDIPRVAGRLAGLGIDAAFRFAGDGPERARLEAAMAGVGSRTPAVFLGALSPQDLQAEYRQASVVLIASDWETGPLVLWEAMAAGCPVVSSTYTGSGAEAALQDGSTCLTFDVGDVEGAALALQRLATSPELALALAARGYGLVQARYTQEASVRQWAGAFARIREQPRRRGAWPRPSVAERAREWLRGRIGRCGLCDEAGGEWPYTHSPGAALDEASFLKAARAMDHQEEQSP